MTGRVWCGNVIAVINGRTVKCWQLPVGHPGLCIGRYNRRRVYEPGVTGDKPPATPLSERTYDRRTP